MMIKYPQIILVFHKESNHSDRRCAWANYNYQGKLNNITDFYGQNLSLYDGNKVVIDGDIWVLESHLHKVYRDRGRK